MTNDNRTKSKEDAEFIAATTVSFKPMSKADAERLAQDAERLARQMRDAERLARQMRDAERQARQEEMAARRLLTGFLNDAIEISKSDPFFAGNTQVISALINAGVIAWQTKVLARQISLATSSLCKAVERAEDSIGLALRKWKK